MDQTLDRVKSLVVSSRKLARLLAGYQRLSSRFPVPTAAFGKALDGIGVAAAELPAPEVRAEVERWLAGERAKLAAVREEMRFSFGSGLAEALESLRISLRGQLPVVRVGMFSLRVDFDGGSAALYWGPGVEKLVSGIPLSPSSVAEAVKREQVLLRRRAFAPARLGRLLQESYRRWLSVSGQEPGARAPLIGLLAELVMLIQPEGFRSDPVRRRFAEYPRVQFSYDLHRLRTDAPGGPFRLHVATFDSTAHRAKALWVPDNEEGEGTHYSHLSFPVVGEG